MTQKNSLLIRYTVLLVGIVLLGLGISLMIRAELGVNPWAVFHIGISSMTMFSIGQVTQLVGLVLVVVGGILLKQKPGIGTIINMALVGWFVDRFLAEGVLPFPDGLALRLVFLFGGIAIIGLGTGMYIAARLGAGPRDAVMLGLSKLTGWQVGTIRSLMEASVLVVGFLLGGPVGLGTVAAIGVGPIVQFSLKTTTKLMEGVFVAPTPQPYAGKE